jgi:hypothetical protein
MNAQLERVSIDDLDLQAGARYALDEPPDNPFTIRDIAIPRWQAPILRNFAQMAKDVRAWTGWSTRALAEAVGTTHPTIRQILDAVPGSGTRRPDMLRRLEQVHGVVARIYLMAGSDSRRAAAVLAAGPAGRSAVDYLSAGEANKAYLAALDVLQPREGNGLLVGARPVQPGRGTVDYLDPD